MQYCFHIANLKVFECQVSVSFKSSSLFSFCKDVQHNAMSSCCLCNSTKAKLKATLPRLSKKSSTAAAAGIQDEIHGTVYCQEKLGQERQRGKFEQHWYRLLVI